MASVIAGRVTKVGLFGGVPGGQPAAQQFINVYVGTSSTLATVYADRISGTTVANPVATDQMGDATFFLAPGDYTLTWTIGDITFSEVETVRSDPNFATFSRSRTFTQGTHVTAGPVAITALPGDLIINNVAAGDASTYTVTLPEIAVGGPVLVKVTGQVGQVSNKVIVIPTVPDTVAGVLIDGYGSVSLIQPNSLAVFASDDANWWLVSRFHNTTDTW